RQGKSFTAQEALDAHLIELIAANERELIQALNGREITRFDGRRQRLDLTGAVIEHYRLSVRERLLMPLIDPNLAFVLLIVGALCVYVTFTHPGLIVLGGAGGILV